MGAGKNPWLGKLLFALGAALLLAAGVGYYALRTYLHSDGFRKLLAVEVGRAAKMEGSFEPFRWDGLAVETGGFHAAGTGTMAGVEADQIDTEVGFGGIRRGVWEIKATSISRLALSLDFTKGGEPPPAEPEQRKKEVMKEQPGWVPGEVELESLEVGEMAIHAKTASGEIRTSGMSLHVTPDGGKRAFKGEMLGGTVLSPFDWMPELRVKRIVGAYRDGSAFITKAEVNAWEDARISAFGEWDSRSHTYSFEGNLDRARCADLLDENWARRLTGEVSSTFFVDNLRGHMVMAGNLEILNGTLTALPMLDSLAAYADTRRFRVLQLNEARANWRWEKGGLFLTDIAMGSEGLIRIEGSLRLRGENLDGRFRLGLVPGTLSRIPGAETDVFLPGTHGLLWAPLNITGTLEHPQEDLTERLIGAAGMRMFETLPETGETVLRFTQKAIGNDPGGAIGKGFELLGKGNSIIGQGKAILGDKSKVMEKGEKAIEAVESILGGVLGDAGLLRPDERPENPSELETPVKAEE